MDLSQAQSFNCKQLNLNVYSQAKRQLYIFLLAIILNFLSNLFPLIFFIVIFLIACVQCQQKYQRMRGPKRTVEVLTGQIQPVSFKDMQTRINVIRSRNKMPTTRYTIDNPTNRRQYSSLNKTEELKSLKSFTADLQTDQLSTNFNPHKPQINQVRPATKSFTRSRPITTKAAEIALQQQKIRPQTSYKRALKISRTNLGPQIKQNNEGHAVIYKQQMQQFKNLYEHLAKILGCINEGDLQLVEQMIKEYIEYIQSKKISFIDDFINGKQRQFQKVIRQSRLDQSLSIAYLFLEMAQNRIQNHESYLTNFIGYCLSNVLLLARIYILKQRKSEFEQSLFQLSIKQIQIGSFGTILTSRRDVLLRMQHNNEIITMMHRKLGRFNPKFEACIQLFFKNAQRKKISCVQCTYYIFEYLSMHIHESQLTGISKTLQMAPSPYCPPPIKSYTLVMQPLGILISQGRTRPYLFQFLQWASKYFDIILWTWQMPYQPQVEKFYRKIDQYITYRLYRYHCIDDNQIWVKDLNRIGRPLQKMLIVDYDKRIFARQPKNGIELRWHFGGLAKDKGLLLLCQILQQMVESQSIVEDMVTIYAEQLFNIRGY